MFLLPNHHRSLILPALGLALALLLSGCMGQSMALTGKITDAYTGKPVPAATAKLGETAVTTAAGGTYRFAAWRRNDTLALSAAGYAPAQVLLAAQPQLAHAEPPAATLNATLRPDTLAGVITDSASGQPVAGATVQISSTLRATTGRDGRYRLSGVPESVTLTVSAPDHAPVRQTLSRTTVFDVKLRTNVLTGTVTDQYSSAPIAGASVKAGSAAATTGADGHYRLENLSGKVTIVLSADGYAPVTRTLDKLSPLDVALRPNVLKGTLVDNHGGPIKNATIIATTSITGTDVAYTRIDNSPDGRWTLKDIPEQGYLQVLAPGYRKVTLPLKRGEVPPTIKLQPFEVKAIYITAGVASLPKWLREYIDQIDNTELNAIVID